MLKNRSKLNIDLLDTFVTVCENSSFTSAADVLSLTPAAVSSQIKRLEEITEKLLFERTTRRTKLTTDGEMLLSYAYNILDIERNVRLRMQSTNLECLLRIGSTEDFICSSLPEILSLINKCNPYTSIEVHVGLTQTLLSRMNAMELDIVFGKVCGSMSSYGHLLHVDSMVWATNIDPQYLLDKAIPLAVFPDSCVYRIASTSALNTHNIPWRIALESSSLHACISAASASLAVTPIASSQMPLNLSKLTINDGFPPLPNVGFYLFSNSENPKIQSLVEDIKLLYKLNLINE